MCRKVFCIHPLSCSLRISLLSACAAETAFSSTGLVEGFHFFPLHMLVAGYDHLGYPFTWIYGKSLIREIYQYHLDFASVV